MLFYLRNNMHFPSVGDKNSIKYEIENSDENLLAIELTLIFYRLSKS